MKYAMLIDLTLCTGCNSCAVACKQQNRLNEGVRWININLLEQKSYSRYEYYFPQSCRHCKEPECVKVCPTGAILRNDEGFVLLNEDKCIGCSLCVQSCQYGGISFNYHSGKAGKCRLCYDRIKEGKIPACAENCSTEARYFAAREELLKVALKRIEKLQKNGQKAILKGDLEENLVLYIIPEGPALKSKRVC